MNTNSTRVPRFYHWDTPEFWEQLSQLSSPGTSTDKKLSGDSLDAIEASSKELGATMPELKESNMSPHQSENELIIKAVRWATKTATAIQDAGGSVDSVLERFPDELVTTMVRNGLHIKHER